MNIFRKRVGQQKTEMKRTLNSMDLVLLGLGSMVGSGIFTFTGIGAATIAGPALIISIIIAAVAVGISALIFAEFASRVPSHGGPYGYLYAIFGEFPAWIAGWLLAMEFFTVIALVAKSWSGYFKGLISVHLPAFLSGPIGSQRGFSIDLIPMLVIAGVSVLVLFNARTVLRLNNTLVILKFSALIVFIVVGLFYLEPSNWSNFAPFGVGSLVGGNTGIIAGSSMLFVAFIGFEAVSTAVDEAEDPQHNVPYGIIWALVVTVVFYIIVTLVLTGVVPYYKLNVTNSVAFALQVLGVRWAAVYVSVIAIFTLLTVAIAMSYAVSRLIYSMSRDGLLPKYLSKVSTKHKTPTNSSILIGVISMIIVGLVPLTSLAQFLNLCTLVYLTMLAIGIIKLRKDYGKPEEGAFKAPLVPFLPILSICINIFLSIHFRTMTWISLIISLIVAIIIYFAYSYKNSKLQKKSISVVTKDK